MQYEILYGGNMRRKSGLLEILAYVVFEECPGAMRWKYETLFIQRTGCLCHYSLCQSMKEVQGLLHGQATNRVNKLLKMCSTMPG